MSRDARRGGKRQQLHHLLIALIVTLLTGARVAAQTTEGVVLTIYPGQLTVDHGRDHPRFVVVARFADGSTRDVTEDAHPRILEASIAVLKAGRVVGRSPGQTTLVVSYEGAAAEAAVVVHDATTIPEPSFHRDVMPILTRMDCNSGGCHGAASGKNGFRLSLFGFDPKKDHERLTRELRGRRLDPSSPEESLLVKKPSMKVGHKGGLKLPAEHPSFEELVRWIDHGATLDGASPGLKALEVLPPEVVLTGAAKTQRFLVRAIYDDGTDRDVTDLALMSSSNETSAALSDQRVVTSGAPGEAFLMARFGTLAQVAQVIVVSEAPFEWPADVVPLTKVDEFIHAKLKKLRRAPASICTDEAFVRRVHLDVINLLPTLEETRAFLKDPRPDKRARLVDALLQRPEFPEVWAMKWAEVLRVEEEKLDRKGMYLFTDFLKVAFAEGRPFDVLVSQMLTAKGGNFTSPAANFFLTERDPKSIAENVAQIFLGIRIQCAQCHNHPFERWTMDDYYGFAAFFSQVSAKPGEDPREVVIYDLGAGEMRHIVDGRTVTPRYLGGAEPDVPKGLDRRKLVAEWLTAKDNPWFAANVANRLWDHVFGSGLIDPPDDVRTTNPPSHPELYRYLADRLTESHFDVRVVLREILTSRTYQLATVADPPPARTFAAAPVRRLTAEQLLDAVSQVTGTPTKYRGLPLGARATQVVGGRSGSEFLDIFGRPPRASACTCERRVEPTLSQALHLINGDTVSAKIKDKNGRLLERMSAKASDQEILHDLYEAAYSRLPTEAEERDLLSMLKTGERRVILEDIFWAVLNSAEFLFNH